LKNEGGSVKTRLVAGLIAAFTVVGAVAPASFAEGEADSPGLSLRRTSDTAFAYRQGKRKPRLYLPLYLEVRGAPLDLRVRRQEYTDPITLTQVLHSPDGNESLTRPEELLDGWKGLKDFLQIDIRSRAGESLSNTTARFCPNGGDRQRLDDSGPPVPTYPYECFARGSRSVFLKGMAWGIDEGWAVNLSGDRGIKLDLEPGRYLLTVSVNPVFQELFAMDPAGSVAEFKLRVPRPRKRPCCSEGAEEAMAASSDPSDSLGAPMTGVPTMTDPDPSLLPDLRMMPAFMIRMRNGKNEKSRMSFASMVWVGGASSVVVEGFRRTDDDVMDAYQYFYEGNEVVGRAPVGTFEYDRGDGHFHWHIQQFAAYRVIDAESNELVRSSKQSFCLAPTDPVDLSLDGAAWDVWRTGLGTACGGPEALWIREVLPLGWGDTYYQSRGQAFNVTDLPNGRYYVEVEANPLSLLQEQDLSNNSVRREIVLKGKAGARRVKVLPWNGIWL
jgi:hypothetical protein